MRRSIVKQIDYDLTAVAGLSLMGHCLNALIVTTQGKSRVRSLRMHGFVEGVLGDWHSHSDI